MSLVRLVLDQGARSSRRQGPSLALLPTSRLWSSVSESPAADASTSAILPDSEPHPPLCLLDSRKPSSSLPPPTLWRREQPPPAGAWLTGRETLLASILSTEQGQRLRILSIDQWQGLSGLGRGAPDPAGLSWCSAGAKSKSVPRQPLGLLDELESFSNSAPGERPGLALLARWSKVAPKGLCKGYSENDTRASVPLEPEGVTGDVMECGRGDKRTKRGKRFKGSFGISRPSTKQRNRRLREKWEIEGPMQDHPLVPVSITPPRVKEVEE